MHNHNLLKYGKIIKYTYFKCSLLFAITAMTYTHTYILHTYVCTYKQIIAVFEE